MASTAPGASQDRPSPHIASHMRRIHLTSLIATCSLALLSSCDFQAQAKERSFGLADDYRISPKLTIDLEGGEYDAVSGQLIGALEMLCGTPAQPQFLRLPEWVDSGYDPNWPTYAEDDGGSGEIGEGEKVAIAADNERVFRLQLSAIERGDYTGVVPFRGAPRLQEKWDVFLADALEDENEDGAPDFSVEESPNPPEFLPIDSEKTFKEEAKVLLTTWYPSLKESAELYRLECLHCHGTEGSGDGSTAPFLNPRPRNYQHGVFKWKATTLEAHPRRADLYKIISDGAYTSAMPSFRRFSRAQIHGLVDMVRLLAIRGETERLLALAIHYENAMQVPLTPDLIIETYGDVWDNWDAAADKLITYDGDVPMPTAESIALSRKRFMDAETGNCFSCHGELGLGDGTAIMVPDPNDTDADDDGEIDKVWMSDEWGEEITPRNLTTGIFRGGRRPIDIYRRITTGIRGTPMPAIPDILTEEDRWALVHYVLSLSERHDGVGLDSLRTMHGDDDHGEDHDSDEDH